MCLRDSCTSTRGPLFVIISMYYIALCGSGAVRLSPFILPSSGGAESPTETLRVPSRASDRRGLASVAFSIRVNHHVLNDSGCGSGIRLCFFGDPRAGSEALVPTKVLWVNRTTGNHRETASLGQRCCFSLCGERTLVRRSRDTRSLFNPAK